MFDAQFGLLVELVYEVWFFATIYASIKVEQRFTVENSPDRSGNR
jgi:hypothetical protein